MGLCAWRLQVVPGELTIITGVPNSGKSEWIDALLVNLAEQHGWSFALCSMEKKARHSSPPAPPCSCTGRARCTSDPGDARSHARPTARWHWWQRLGAHLPSLFNHA